MDECPSENQIAELLSGVIDHPSLTAHLDRCPTCFAAVVAALRAASPAPDPRFMIVRRLGAGGMGTVYEAYDRVRDARVALKVLHHTGPDALLRFKREFRVLRRLHHPNVVRLGELVIEGDRWFYTMELLDGVRLLEHVRPAGPHPPGAVGYDGARLSDAFGQLVLGLSALHAVGKIHRDVKASNVLVTRDGRVVLIDLGLVLDQRGDGESSGGHALGTVVYMAPEQAFGRPIAPAADWYATGILLYEALTGRLPFTGGAHEVAAQKQRGRPPPPCDAVPAIPAALNELCLALLDPEPAARPAAADILRVLTGGDAATIPSFEAEAAFVGRDRELDELARMLEATRRGRPAIIAVTGEAGIGKTALVQRFAKDRRAHGAVVLAGRCDERESVPFGAIDGVVDALSHHLARLPAVEAAAMLPRQTQLLARVFPVLARVGPIAEAPPGPEVDDPEELRRRALGALRELLARLADRRPLAMVIDDMDRAPGEAFELLAELLHPPDAPALLLVVVLGHGAGAASRAQLAAARAALGGAVGELAVAALAPGEARALAALLAGRRSGRGEIDPAAVADEAAGHPGFVLELVRQAPIGAAARVRLDHALGLRIAQLPPAARRILQLAAVAHGGLRGSTAARAAGVDRGALDGHVDLLCAAHLLRTGDATAADLLEPYHERVRAAVLACTGDDDVRALHRALACALEAEVPADAEAVALHWRDAGERDRAATCAADAAERRARAGAFATAARLYRLALALDDAAPDRARAQRWRVELGHALAGAGCGAEAAHAYLAAADHAASAEALELRRRASEELVRSGHIDDGIAVLRGALRPFAIDIPAAQVRGPCRWRLRWPQVRLRLRRREHGSSDLPACALPRIDLYWSLSSSLCFIDPAVGRGLSAMHLLLARRAGEPTRVCRARAHEAVYAAGAGATRRCRRLSARATTLAARLDQPYVSGILRLCRGSAAALLGSFAEAHSHVAEAQRILRAGVTGVAWELEVAEVLELEMLSWMGCLHELRCRVPTALRDAEDRNARYFATALRVGLPGHLTWLQIDDVDQARREALEALRTWTRSGFQVQHYWHLYAQAQIDLYRGDGAAAHARLRDQWERLERSRLLHVPYFRIPMRELRARCALAAARQLGERAPSEARALIAGAERDIRRLRCERAIWADALAALLDAGVAHLRADDAGVLGNLSRAVHGFSAAEMALFATAAQQRLAELRRDRGGAALAENVTFWLARHDVKVPARMIAMMTPAFD